MKHQLPIFFLEPAHQLLSSSCRNHLFRHNHHRNSLSNFRSSCSYLFLSILAFLLSPEEICCCSYSCRRLSCCHPKGIRRCRCRCPCSRRCFSCLCRCLFVVIPKGSAVVLALVVAFLLSSRWGSQGTKLKPR